MLFKISCFWVLVFYASTGYSSSITYEFSGGRLGDNLLIYINALYLSHKYQIPLIYEEFQYSNFLNLHKINQNEKNKNFKNFRITNENFSSFENLVRTSNDLNFILPFGVDAKIDLNDAYFLNLLKEHIKPIVSLKMIIPPKDTINIAVHVRDGGNFDKPGWHLIHPMKCPDISFYIDAIKEILNSFKEQNIYCYIFTDAINPKAIKDKICSALRAYERLQIESRDGCTNYINVLEDFFSMSNFNILIRPFSAFSIAASYLHKFEIICEPKSYIIVDNKVLIPEINLINQQ